MSHDGGHSAADFARSLLIKEVAPELTVTEASGFGATEAPLELVDAVAPDIERLVPRNLPDNVSRDEVTAVALKTLSGEELSEPEQFITEAIIIPDLRPAVFVKDGDYQIDHPAWPDYVAGKPAHETFLKAIPSVGRIDLIGHPSLPYGGTGFLVGPNLLMTNRHVAEIFAAGLGTRGLRFLDGLGAEVDFVRERESPPEGSPFAIRQIVMIHPYWDLALLRVEGLEGRIPLTFGLDEPSAAQSRRIAVIGYPAFDPRNDAKVQDQVFRGVYNVKRLQPGLFNGRRKISSFGKQVNAATHDSSTLGGNSGSVIVDAETGHVLGLHFAGIYKDSNFAVPACDLARDGRMIDAGLKFSGSSQRSAGPWDAFWDRSGRENVDTSGSTKEADPQQAAGPTKQVAPGRVTIPLEIELSIEVAGASLASEPTSGPELIEKMVEPIHDPIEKPRAGYDKDFLGAEVPPPKARRPDECVQLADGTTKLDYHHFSVVMNRERRIALFTAANVDGSKAAKEPEPGHKYTRAGLTGLVEGDVEKWYGDPRIRGIEQLPDRFFNKDRKAFDKGHLVRREDVAWGKSFDEVRAANGDTYFVTNCSPQTAGFNRSNRRDNWGALEDLVLSQAANERYCLFSGPVLGDDDPDFTGVDDLGGIVVKIPRKYWKVVVANSPEGLRLFAFVLEQDLADTPMEFAVPDSWLPHMVRLSELEKELGSLDFDQRLHEADQYDLVQAITAIEALQPAIVEAPAEAAGGHGRFVGLPASVTFDNLEEARRSAHLLSPISYFDPAESEWPVPSGAWLDGASIPRAFWTLIGSPFTGRYLEPSMVHDHYCITRNRPWRDTHRMFHEAMLCRGVSSFKAKVMFYSVYRFGPRWGEPGVEVPAQAPSVPEPLTNAKAPSILADAQALARNDLSLEEIERMVDERQGAGSPASKEPGTNQPSRSKKSRDELV